MAPTAPEAEVEANAILPLPFYRPGFITARLSRISPVKRGLEPSASLPLASSLSCHLLPQQLTPWILQSTQLSSAPSLATTHPRRSSGDIKMEQAQESKPKTVFRRSRGGCGMCRGRKKKCTEDFDADG